MRDDQRYQGSGDSPLEHAQAGKMLGGAAGIAAGAAAGAAAHKPTITKKIRDALDIQKRAALHEHGDGWKHGEMPTEQALENAEKFLSEHSGLSKFWHSMGRGGKMLTGAFVGMLTLGYIGKIAGYFQGLKNNRKGKDLENLAMENQMLRQSLESIQTQAAAGKSFADNVRAQREQSAPGQGRGI